MPKDTADPPESYRAVTQAAERKRERLEKHAERLLEGPLKRLHWSSATRDAVVSFLDKTIDAEIRARGSRLGE